MNMEGATRLSRFTWKMAIEQCWLYSDLCYSLLNSVTSYAKQYMQISRVDGWSDIDGQFVFAEQWSPVCLF